MTTRRIVKPTGWVVDMRHYLDDQSGDLPDVIPERVLGLAIFFGAIVAWVTNRLPKAIGSRMCRADAALAGGDAAARSLPNSTVRLDTLSGSVHSVATTV